MEGDCTTSQSHSVVQMDRKGNQGSDAPNNDGFDAELQLTSIAHTGLQCVMIVYTNIYVCPHGFRWAHSIKMGALMQTTWMLGQPTG
eukprot:1161900-Pelagomonas_calceolata.AAC.6